MAELKGSADLGCPAALRIAFRPCLVKKQSFSLFAVQTVHSAPATAAVSAAAPAVHLIEAALAVGPTLLGLGAYT